MSDRQQGVLEDSPVFEDLPVRTSGGGRPAHDWVPLLKVLYDNPGNWARLGTWATTAGARGAYNVLRTDESRRPPGEFEFTVRKLPDGRSGLWARYVGENGTGE